MSVIKIDNLSQQYPIKFIESGKVRWQQFWALKNIDLKVKKGEIIGLIGPNGAGKTTLLKLIAGMLIADKGSIKVKGRVSSLMELGAGFNPEFTGRENIILNAKTYGFSKQSIGQRLQKIIEFADIGKFIDAPIKYYSQGMYMRLAFALAIFVEPDILLIDDILAVGDNQAQKKCIKKIIDFRDKGKTIILVSHNMDIINLLSSRAIFLHQGEIIKDEAPASLIPYYLNFLNAKQINIKEELPASDNKIIKNQNVSLVANQRKRRLDLYVGGHRVTASNGLSTSFFVEQRHFSFIDALWRVKNVSDKQMKIFLTYEFMSLTIKEVVNCIISDEAQLFVKTKIDAEKPLHIHHYQMKVELSGDYQNWLTDYEQGDFKGANYFNTIYPVPLRYNPSVVSLYNESESSLMPLSLEIYGVNRRSFMGFHRRREKGEECVAVDCFIPVPQYIDTPQELSFESRIVAGSKNKQQNPVADSGGYCLQQGGNKVIFSNNRGQIVTGDSLITDGMGLHSSLSVLGIWHDSSQVLWQLQEKGDNCCSFLGYWARLPLLQKWIMRLENNCIYWQIIMELEQTLALEAIEVNIMLSQDYNLWQTADGYRGLFTDFYSKNYNRIPFRFWSGIADRIVLEGNKCPQLSFSCENAANDLMAVVENSHYVHQARVVKFQKLTTGNLDAGKYNIFNGRINIL
jgi:ABC-type polysaccharide/polyol phosphate transport system ATPase subunit